jgi:ATP-dependent exoDNAse (exonuclease V) beta subunit
VTAGEPLTLFDLAPDEAVGELTGPGGRAFTAEQARAVRERSGALLLEANAGSGKTSVLVERFVRMVVDDRIPAREILAITFTEKAAGELRTRVRERFGELGDREAARDTEAAWISTIHGFCARVLRGHAIAAGLDPGFAVLDEAEARAVREGAFDAALAGFLDAGDAPALDLVAAYGLERPAYRLQTIVQGIHDELRSRGETSPRLPTVSNPGPPEAERRALRDACEAAARRIGEATNGKVVDAALAAIGGCRELLDGLADGEMPAAAALDAALLKGNAGALRSDEAQAYVSALAAYAQACADRRAAAAVRLLDDLLARYATAYEQAKRARGALDFDDLELLTRDLLAGDPALRATLVGRFARVMVDEFQDTNPLQLELLELLAGDNLFVVGDELQSIYGFRHADVAVFRGLRTRLAASDRVAALSGNFRSAPEILDALNAAFAPRFGAGFVPLAPMLPRAGGAPAVELLVTDARSWDEDGAPDLGSTLPPAPAWRRAEARVLAQRVRDLVDAGEAEPREIVVLLRATGAMAVFERALEDQGLLTYAAGGRGYWSRQQVRDLVAYLAALANPRDEEALLSVLASPLCGVSSDALAIVARTGRSTRRGAWRALHDAFVAGDGAADLARGPSGEDGVPVDGVGAADLARRLPEEDGAGVEGAASAELSGQGGAGVDEAAAADLARRLPEADRARLATFAVRFDAERRRAPRLPIAVLLRRVIADTGYDLHVLALPGGPRRMANVHKLLRLAAAYEESRGRDLRGFADFAVAEEEAGGAEADAPVEAGGAQAVRLMTVHAAKGLEFPVVCVADLGRKPQTSSPDLVVRDGRVGLRLVTLEGGASIPALAHAELCEAAQLEAAHEEDRIAYVAMTRAQRRLILSGAVDPERWPEDKPASPPIGWIGRALVPDLPERMRSAAEPVAVPESAAAAAEPVAVVETTAAGFTARVALSVASPATVGPVLRPESLAPVPPHEPGTPATRDPEPVRLGLDAPTSPPMAAGRWAGSLSYTALGEYAACGYRFYLQRVLRLPDEPPPGQQPAVPAGLDPRVRGVLVHGLLEEIDFADPRPPDPDRVAAFATAEGRPLGADDARDVAALVAAFGRSPLCRRLAAAATGVRREHAFAFDLERGGQGRLPLVGGVVDVRATEPDGTVLVVDYKTDRTGGADLDALVDRDYATQRRVYALAALRDGAHVVEVAYCFLERPEEVVARRFAAADAPRLEQDLRELAAGAADGPFPVTDAPHRDLCLTCPGRPALCSHPEAMTLRERPAR